MRKFVLTGGPCTGKTTLLNQLSDKGYTIIPEVPRTIIREEQEKKEENPEYPAIFPWTDLEEFENISWKRQIRKEQQVNGEIHFLDRSLVDILAYADLGDAHIAEEDVDKRLKEAAYDRVFFLEQVPYQTDEQRIESREEAARIHDRLYEFYDEFGYDLVTVPVLAPEKRLEFILKNIGEEKLREKEGKFKAAHADLQRALDSHVVAAEGSKEEENTLYDLFGILRKRDCLFRLRRTGNKHKLTVKGPDRGTQYKDKFELEFSINKRFYHLLRAVLPESGNYDKTRSNFKPLGDPRCTISLDVVKGLGEYVEIEAGSENQIEQWKRRLNIQGEAIRQSYAELTRR